MAENSVNNVGRTQEAGEGRQREDINPLPDTNTPSAMRSSTRPPEGFRGRRFLPVWANEKC